MKQNQHQAGEKNNRPASPKQARAAAGQTTAKTPSQPKLRFVMGSDPEDRDLMVNDSGPEQFYIKAGLPLDAAPQPVSRAEAVAWFIECFVPKELKADFQERQTGESASVSKAALGKLNVALNEQYETNQKNEALLHLLHGQFNVDDSDGMIGREEGNGRLSCGVMLLCQDMAEEVQARHDAVGKAVEAFRAGKEGAL